MKSFRLRASLFTLLLPLTAGLARASIAYGSINNFDTVNDTGHECHGFEIELEDCHSTDITYTYNYNHYGVPKITQDDSVPGHPRCVIRWESKKNPDGSWAAFTAIPSGPIEPTNGHMFTNPNVNFGGEHFGVGYYRQPTAIRYQWLIDGGAGNLVHGGAVQVSTPAFTYYPPAGGAPAQVQAVIEPPEPPEVPVKEFGEPVWVKEIRTTSHNDHKVKLRDLVSDDPDDDDDINWRNGEPDEVEVEWQLLQTEFSKVDGGNNGELAAEAEDLPDGDEVVTRRYEFYKYTGPIDEETGEAQCDNVGPDGIHGEGIGEIDGAEVDFADYEVAGDYTGAQMAAVDVEAGVGLTEHLGEGEEGAPYAARRVVIQGAAPFTASVEGALPAGMTLDVVSGILSGTPSACGDFTFTVKASDAQTPEQARTYTMVIAAAGQELPPASLLDTVADPVAGGSTTGSDSYAVNARATVTATASPGWHFVRWEDNGAAVSLAATYTLTMNINHSLVAKFAPAAPAGVNITAASDFAPGGTVTGGGNHASGSAVTLMATPSEGYRFTHWTLWGLTAGTTPAITLTAAADATVTAHFEPVLEFTSGAARLQWPASAAGWHLQESSDLAEPWADSTAPVTQTGGRNEVSIPATRRRGFFRLRGP
jgi:Divergent InlB B-repeat domain/Putative Ig domain